MQVTSHCGGHLVGGKPCASWWTASELRITKLREGSYFPSLLEPRRRSEKALPAVIQQAYVEGVLLPWADQIYQWIANDRLQMTRIHELLVARGCELSLINWRKRGKTTVRMEDTPLGYGVPSRSPEAGRHMPAAITVTAVPRQRRCRPFPASMQGGERVLGGQNINQNFCTFSEHSAGSFRLGNAHPSPPCW